LDTLARCPRNQVLQVDDERLAALGARGQALRRRQAVDLALDREQGIDAATASLTIGALLILTGSKKLRLAWAQQAASMIGAWSTS
jgi:hypothetical protein